MEDDFIEAEHFALVVAGESGVPEATVRQALGAAGKLGCSIRIPHPGDFQRDKAALAASINLGYEVEQDTEYIAQHWRGGKPSWDEIEWLAAWLAGEGWSK